MRIAVVSVHASPLAAVGSVDAGGQNLRVAELSKALVRQGHDVTVYTRRDNRELAAELVTEHGYRVVHVPAGPARHVPADDLPRHLGGFTRFLRARWTPGTSGRTGRRARALLAVRPGRGARRAGRRRAGRADLPRARAA